MQSLLGGALKHSECSELIVDYVAGTLDARREVEFQRHIESCTGCWDAVAGQRAVWAALDQWRSLPVSPDFDRRLFKRIAEAESHGRWSWRALVSGR
ncbi:MAG: zf-HC2 domain-containing protein [Bryobacteraceae bacterium]|jgi:anti-sigma factor RsiW